MKNNEAKVSIITVCYNAVDSIEETILSVINQTYTQIEYIIVDGGSKDGTVDVIKKYEDRIALWSSEPDKGIYDAMNKGISRATGDWINFMNCGDHFVNEGVIEEIFCKERKGDVVYGNREIGVGKARYAVLPEEMTQMTEHLPFCHQSVFVRTTLAQEMKFDTAYRYAADYHFFHQLYVSQHSFEYVNVDVAFYNTEDGLTANHVRAMYAEIARIAGKKMSKRQRLMLFWSEKIKSWIPKSLTERIRVRKYRKNPRFILLD